MSRAIYSEEHRYTVAQLRKARIETGLTQAQVARMLGKTQSYVSKIESGQRRIDVVQLRGFVRVYKKPIGFFVR